MQSGLDISYYCSMMPTWKSAESTIASGNLPSANRPRYRRVQDRDTLTYTSMENKNLYEEEIDLRIYVKLLFKHWKWIVGSAVVCGMIALTISFFSPPVYEASALVAVTQPRYVLRFDPRLESADQLQQPPYRAYPDLATSDDVLRVLIAQIPPSTNRIESLHSLRNMLEATSGGDPSLIRLKSRSGDPEEAARIANVWADIFISRTNTIYGRNTEQADFFAGQLARAQVDLEATESALIAFQSQNQLSILDNRLESLLQVQADYLAEQRNITFLIQNTRSTRAQLAAQPADYSMAFADELTALLLQIRAFNPQSETPFQFLIDSTETLSTQSVTEQIAQLDILVTVLNNHSQEVREKLADLEPDILALQGEIQQAKSELERLTYAQDLARETHQTLARKVDESRIAAADSGGEVVFASRAAVPERAARPRKMLNTAVAGTLGGASAVLGIFVSQWWREE